MSRDAVRRKLPFGSSSATTTNGAPRATPAKQRSVPHGRKHAAIRDALAKSRSLMRAELIDGAASTATSLKQAIACSDGSWLHEDTHATSVAIDHVDVESTPCSRGCDHLNRELLGKECS